MDLGSSIRRRRKRRERPPVRKRTRGRTRDRTGGRTRGRTWVPGRIGVPGMVRAAYVAVALALGGLASGYLVATRFIFPPGEPPASLQDVPDLSGLGFGAAAALLADSGLSVERIDSVRHPMVAAGTVIGQSPLPGRTALPGAAIRITLSVGPEIGAVPDVTRLLGGRARRVLEASGFVVRVDTVESEAAAGRVIVIDPAPGTELALPGDVRLEVSLGPPTLPLPDLSGMWIEEAIAALDSLGLIVSEFDRRYSILNVDRVFAQHPAPHTQVEAGTAIRLTIGQAMVRPRQQSGVGN